MQLEAEAAGAGAAGALLAALAGERDIVLGSRAFGGTATDRPPAASDLLVRLELFEDAARRGFSAGACEALGLDPSYLARGLIDRPRFAARRVRLVRRRISIGGRRRSSG